ncbi:MAG: hypothetical protein KIT33_13260, partial [Candidatus Kapabacteria bacterium]|nr:hypothetical protein [Candidatus Kapabacteria bacterium]
MIFHRLLILVILILLSYINNSFAEITWAQKNIPAKDMMYRSLICADNSNCYCLTAMQGYTGVLKSENPQRLWRSKLNEFYTKVDTFPRPKYSKAYEIAAPFNGHVFLASDRGMIRRTKDDFKTMDTVRLILHEEWEEENLYASGIRHISMVDTNYGVASTSKQMFFTRDGWNTFDSIPGPLEHKPDGYIMALGLGAGNPLYMIDSNNFLLYVKFYHNPSQFVFISKSGIAKTSNRGKSWDFFTLCDNDTHEQPVYYVIRFDFVNDKIGWAVGSGRIGNDSSYVYKTTDGGLNWKVQLAYSDPFVFELNNLFFRDSLHGFVLGRIGKILSTYDGGETWNDENPNMSSEWSHGKSLMSGDFAGDIPMLSCLDDGIFVGTYNTSSVDYQDGGFGLYPNPA